MVHTNQIDSTERNVQTDEAFASTVQHGNILMDQLLLPDENITRQGYALLAQDIEPVGYFSDSLYKSSSDNDEDDEDFENAPTFPLNNGTSKLDDSFDDSHAPFVSSTHTPPAAVEMDSEKVEEVKQVMANIILPSSAIPEWAETVPEEEWKEYLFNKLHIRRGN